MYCSLGKSVWLVCISSLIPRGLGFHGWFRIPSPCSDQASRPSPAGGRGAPQALGPGRWGEGLVVHLDGPGRFHIPSPGSHQVESRGGRGSRQAPGRGRWGEGLVVHFSPFLRTGPPVLVRLRGSLRKSGGLLVRAPRKSLWGGGLLCLLGKCVSTTTRLEMAH